MIPNILAGEGTNFCVFSRYLSLLERSLLQKTHFATDPSFLGALAGGLPFYLGAGFGKNGAGDTVLAASAGFVLGLSRTLAGLTLFAFCYALFVLGKSLVLKLSHRPTRFTCPLVPFIAAGFIPAYFL